LGYKAADVSTHTIVRPVVRSFTVEQEREAAVHVRAGGHAIVWEHPKRARLVLPVPKKGDPEDLALHSILDLGKSRFRISERGATKGLATALVEPGYNGVLRQRIERDSEHPGPTRAMTLDCAKCAACCHSNHVELGKKDIKRFEQGGRPELALAPYARRSDGKLMLRLAPDGACIQLGPGNRCNIYAIRPEACRTFPVGSECCLSARADDFGIYDGQAPGA
jgi:hypothetical protein